MITAIVQFTVDTPLSPAMAKQLFEASAPNYRGVDGLIRKYYLLSDDGLTVGGCYLWETRAQAEAQYSPGWRALVEQRYGCVPGVQYFSTPVVVDNPPGDHRHP